jgi:predicted transcriptional regulator
MSSRRWTAADRRSRHGAPTTTDGENSTGTAAEPPARQRSVNGSAGAIGTSAVQAGGNVNKKDNMMEKVTSELELMERHVMMLRATKENQPIGIIRLSEILVIPKHKVRYSLRLLENEGLISPSVEGAKVTEKYDAFMEDAERSLNDLKERIDRLRSIFSRT